MDWDGAGSPPANIRRMFLVRQSKPEDVSTLAKLARMVLFINLPPNEAMIGAKVDHSGTCFAKAAGATLKPRRVRRRQAADVAGWSQIELDSDLFMFSIEDTASGGVIGTSQVRAHQGGPGNPNWSFKITEKSFRSESLGWGTTHKVGQLFADESGPSEVGGLILTPSYRGHPGRPGRLLSFIRFHWIGLHRRLFADRIIAEMAPPVTPDGDNVFWDHFGRKFIPVKYSEADRFCQHNRKFISELLPREEIYLSLFPLEVQNIIGQVSPETAPAKRLLESLGFRNRGFVDPFDTGPHLDALADEVPLIRETRRARASRTAQKGKLVTPAIVSSLSDEGEFRATQTMIEDAGEVVRLSAEVLAALDTTSGATIGVTPMGRWGGPPDATLSPARKARRRGRA